MRWGAEVARCGRRVRLDGETEKKVAAQAKYDRCVKVRLTGLSAATTYHYRFIHTVDGTHHATRTGQVKTAPKPDADVKVRFAVVP